MQTAIQEITYIIKTITEQNKAYIGSYAG